jgi:hypothetical protein
MLDTAHLEQEVGRAGGAFGHGAAVPAVLAVVRDGWKVTEVAARLGVSRQSVHVWIARYELGACPRWLTGRIARALALTRSPPRSRR